jgi:hypothetical protein
VGNEDGPAIATTGEWACASCTFLNSKSTALACKLCATERR